MALMAAGSSSNVSPPVEPKKTASSVHDVHAEQPPFGSRYLTPDKDVWSKNAWDHVPPPEDQDEKIAASLARQRAKPVPEEERAKYNEKPARHWDNFYKMNADNFFRDRKWLHTEFPELVAATQPDAGPVTIAELGCGAGNSVFPLLASNQNPELKLFAFDYSSHAVKLVQHNELYASPPIGSIHAAVWDLTSTAGLPAAVNPGSVDIVVLIFVLSALHPDEWAQAVANIYKVLKPGGRVVLRDYGRHDLAQLRFKEGRLLVDNLYIRGDKTRVYFFELDELALLFTGAPIPSQDRSTALGLAKAPVEDESEESAAPTTPAPNEDAISSEPPSTRTSLPSADVDAKTFSPVPLASPVLPAADNTPPNLQPERQEDQDLTLPALKMPAPFSAREATEAPRPSGSDSPSSRAQTRFATPPNCPAHPLFRTTALGVDRRLLVNRKRQLKMHRVWVQGAFVKLPSASATKPSSECESSAARASVPVSALPESNSPKAAVPDNSFPAPDAAASPHPGGGAHAVRGPPTPAPAAGSSAGLS